MNKFSNYIHRLRTEKRPLKSFLATLLLKTGLCQLFIIKRASYSYRIRFFPTCISAQYWVEPNEREEDENFFVSYLKNGDVVIDVGANVGTLTLTAAAVVGELGKVFSIEAHPVTFNYLEQNIALNGFKNIKIFNVAVGDTNGFVEFSDKKTDDQNAVISGEGLQIPVKKLDDLLGERLKTIHLLKIDVEGYEKFILKGALEILKNTECIYFESWENHYAKYGYTTSDVLEILRASNFSVYKFNEGEIRQVPLKYISEKLENLLAIRNLDLFMARTGFLEVQLAN